MARHLFLFIHDILYAHILYMLHKKMFRVAQKTILCNTEHFFVQHVQNVSIKNIVNKEKQMCSH